MPADDLPPQPRLQADAVAAQAVHTEPADAGRSTNRALRSIQVLSLLFIAVAGVLASHDKDLQQPLAIAAALLMLNVGGLEVASRWQPMTINIAPNVNRSGPSTSAVASRAARARPARGRGLLPASRNAGMRDEAANGAASSAWALPRMVRVPGSRAAATAATGHGELGVPLPYVQHISMLPYSPEAISGLWIKDHERSDSMTPVCDVMQVYGILRHAIRIMKGVQLRLTEEMFRVSVVSIIPGLKVTETYRVNGEVARFKRRDRRPGRHHGRIEVTSKGILLLLRWDEPHGGYGHELFTLNGPDELAVHSEMRIGDSVCKYMAVYHRR